MKLKNTLLLISSGLLLQGCLLEDTELDNGVNPPAQSIPSLKDSVDGFVVGTALPAGDSENSIFNRSDLQKIVEKHFSQITAENIMKPSYLQPQKGNFVFTDANALIDYAEAHEMTVHGHTLVWHTQIPDWMTSECNIGEENCKAVMTDHIEKVIANFSESGVIDSWDVVNEAFDDNGNYRNTGDNGSIWYQKIGKPYISLAYSTAKQELITQGVDADLYYNDYNIEKNDAKLTAVLQMIDEVNVDKNTPLIEGIGFQMHVGLTQPSIDNIRASLKKAKDTGLKVKITELDVRINETGQYDSLTTTLSEQQKQRYNDIVKAYLEIVPASQRGGLSVWGVSDADSWIPDLFGFPDWPLLFDDKLNEKPALKGVSLALIASNPEENVLFSDTFDTAVNWYDATQGLTGNYFSHNATSKAMDITVPWSSSSDTYAVGVEIPNDIDFTSGKTIKFDVYVPSAFGNQGHLALQPIIQSSANSYAGKYDIEWQFGYSLDNWATITINDVTTEVSDIDRLVIKLISNDATLPSDETISIDNVIIK